MDEHSLEALSKAVVLAKQRMVDTAVKATQLGRDATAGNPSEDAFKKWETAKIDAAAAHADFEAKNTAYLEAQRALGS